MDIRHCGVAPPNGLVFSGGRLKELARPRQPPKKHDAAAAPLEAEPAPVRCNTGLCGGPLRLTLRPPPSAREHEEQQHQESREQAGKPPSHSTHKRKGCRKRARW